MSRSFLLAFLKLLALLIISNDAQSQGLHSICTSDGHAGTCVNARNCPMVTTILQQSRDQALAYLKRNHCGYAGSDPLVCCRPTRTDGDSQGVVSPTPNTDRFSNVDENSQINLADNPLLPNPCGRDLTQRLLGGEITELDEFPWMALLEYQKPNGRTTACGGVLISKRYILTAAHCIKGKDLPTTWRLTSVRLGEYNTDTEQDCVKDDEDDSMVCADPTVSVGVEEQIAHEDYRPLSRDQRNDIALLRLSQDVPFTNFIKPICLPSNSTLGNRVFVAGWGKTENRSASNIKLKLGMPLVNKDQCLRTYSNVGVQLGLGQICAGGLRGKDSCRGDSGGPLMTIARNTDGTVSWTSVGVVSFGPSPCGLQGWPGVYTRVFDFVPWIVSKLRP